MKVRLGALGTSERHLQMNPDDSGALGTGAVNLASLGERDRAIEWTERAIEASGEEPIIIYNSACTFAVLGENDRALDLLERSVALGWGAREWIKIGRAPWWERGWQDVWLSDVAVSLKKNKVNQ